MWWYIEFQNSRIIKRTECKTYKNLTSSQASDLASQYRFAQNNNQLSFNILYQYPRISPVEYCNILYINSNKRIIPTQINFVSTDELEESCTLMNFNLFFNHYKITGWEDYQNSLFELNELLFNEILLNSEEEALKRSVEKIRIREVRKRQRSLQAVNFLKKRDKLKNEEKDENNSELSVIDTNGDSLSGGSE